MDITTISIFLKIITWTGGVFISVWIIKLLREINSKQKEYIALIEKTFQEREKTRDQKIDFLDATHKKEIELIEREKSIFFKSMESEKKNLELRLSNTSNFDNSLSNNLIAELKAELTLVVTKVTNLNVLADDLSQLKEIVGIAGDINRKVNYISNDENNFTSKNKHNLSNQEEINLKNFILEIYNSIYSSSSFQIEFDKSFSDIKRFVFNKQTLYIILAEIFNNVKQHSTSKYLRIYGRETYNETKLIFENSAQMQVIDLTESKYWNSTGHNIKPSGLTMINEIMKRYFNEVSFKSQEGKFEIELNFHKNNID